MKGFSSFRRIIYESIKQQAMAEQTAVHANRTVKEEMRMRKYFLSAAVLMFCALPVLPAEAAQAGDVDAQASVNVQTQAKKAFKLDEKVYDLVKGWWTGGSDDSCDRKITRRKIKLYDSSTRKYVSSLRIYNCKKSGNGYVFKLRDSQGEKVTYRFNTKNRILGCYQDNDKDGVCDFYHQGRYYVDENDNGICDHYENGESGQGWRNNGAGTRQAGHHSGSGYGHHAGGGRGGHHHGW